MKLSITGDNQQPQGQGGAQWRTTVGLLVFAIGILMMVMVFWWAYQLLTSIDTQIAQVRATPAVTTPAVPGPPSGSETPAPQTVVAQPRPGFTLAQVAAAIGLKLVGLAALAYIGALVAAKGAQLVSAVPGRNQ